ncbi:PadR family transcriptional regulator [Actinophytocola xanthii]|uniref:PadR family transcriptional regulator n=1 Tax=Actinophytocola xanthii TaxID=1912961 RepID=A0A1Q8CLL8_9PSEU|nr:PadR family transcriptional regulator [Actinophytocola xanthii]OLF15256.1 PadR family transcriptional regulator [Actinophytocola xanthii]
MSATRLLVLGVVRMYGRAHGYQVRRELLTWSADRWANVAPGSIYHALKKMAAEKLLEEVTAEDDGEARGPDKTAYRLTHDGETEFQLLLAKSLSESDDSVQGAHRLSAAVTFLPTLPRARAIGLLRHRITQLRGTEATTRDMIERHDEWGQPEHVDELYRLWLVNTQAMLTWLEDLVARLEAGKYVMADDPGTEFGAPPAE